MVSKKRSRIWFEFKPSLTATPIRVGDTMQGQAVVNKYCPHRVFKTRTSRARSHR